MSERREELRGFEPGGCVRGTFRPSGSKSQAQRALLCAAVAEGETEIDGLSEAEDVRAALALLGAAGVAGARLSAARVRVHGAPPGDARGLAAGAALHAGESGTLARLSTALVALASRPGERWTITAEGSLLFRKSLPLFEALRQAGVVLARQNLPGTWPVELVSLLPPRVVRLSRPVSSQEVSGLCLALAAHPGVHVLEVQGPIPSRPYLEMTRRMLADFGVAVSCEEHGAGERLSVSGPLRAPAAALVLEPDASSAAVALAAACLSGGALRVPGLGADSTQGDVRIVAHLAAFGCDARSDAEGLFAQGCPRTGADLDLAGEPDLAPVLAAVAAAAALRAGAPSRLAGLGTLPGKESDRLAVLAEGLEAAGTRVEVGRDWLRIAPARSAVARPVVLDPRGDHRMVFAFALLSLVRPGVLVREPGCVAKSWGSFWSDLERIGARPAAG